LNGFKDIPLRESVIKVIRTYLFFI